MKQTRDHRIDPDLGEQLSALMDGELDAERSRFLLRRLESDPGLRAAWERWQLASGSLRGQLGLQVDAGFLDRVQAGIDALPAADPDGPHAAPVPVRASAGRWLRWTAGGAIAASVAVVALMATGPGVSPPPAGEALSDAAPAMPSVVAPSALTESDLRPRLRSPAQTVSAQQRGPLRAVHQSIRPVDPRVDPYLMLHDAQLQADGLGAFLPYVEAVRQPDGQPPRLLPEDARR